MRRPAVLHHVEHWARPSEGFVVDTVRSATATRPVVAAQQLVPDSPAKVYGGRVWPMSARLPVHAQLAALAVAERAAVLHAHFGLTAHLTWRAARRLGRPLAVSLHGWDLLVGSRLDPDMLDALRAADLVVVPSRFLAAATEAAGIDPAVVRVVPSGVDLSLLPFRERSRPEGPPLVTFAGRFAPKKGVLDVAEALAVVAAETPIRARFVGHGPLDSELRALLAARRLDAEIVDGRVPGAVRAALAATDIAVTASRTANDGDAETLGLVNIEAQACGAPVVTTAHGGIPEAVSADGALLVAPDDEIVASLAGALRTLLAEPERWAAMGRAGREHVAAHFELGARTADLEELWLALADGARGAGLPEPPLPSAKAPRTSVVVLTHNRRAMLRLTLDALAAQTRPADEVIVVDNGSTDGSAELLAARAAAGNPPGLRVVTRSDNFPVAQSRNVGVGASTGEVVVFTDDDCRPRPTWLESLLAGMRDGIGLVQGRTGADPEQPLHPLSRTQWTPAEFGLYETANIAYRRDNLEAAGPPPPDGPFDVGFATAIGATVGKHWANYPVGEDTELGWRLKRAGARSRFAVHAVVDHEVFPPDPDLLVWRARLAEGFPVIVRRLPELRERFLWHRYVLGPHRARMWLAVGGVVAAVGKRDVRPWALTLPYANRLVPFRSLLRRGGRRARLAAVPVLLRRDAYETVALIRGSVKARTPVL